MSSQREVEATGRPFEVRPILYGGTIGPMIGAYGTLEEAEATYPKAEADLLVIVGPDPNNEGKTCVYSKRAGGKWVRSAILLCESK